jgi:hypothetical protein
MRTCHIPSLIISRPLIADVYIDAALTPIPLLRATSDYKKRKERNNNNRDVLIIVIR